MPSPATRLNFVIALVVGVVVTASVAAWDYFSVLPPGAMSKASYVGRATCAECHQPEHKLWLGSDHDLAMDLATDKTVLADFNDTSFAHAGVTTRFFRRAGKFMVNAEGPDGELHDYEVKYTFGVRPLQQYMVEFPDGRVQVLRVSWDTEKKQWFYVSPPDVPEERISAGDPLHWTGIGQNWNATCADCHSTNVHKNYDPETNTYRTSFDEIDVSCEECHGPGSVHVELAQRWSPFWDRNVGYGLVSLKNKDSNVQLETCAKCHARRYQVHEDFRPGKPFLDHYEPFLLSEGIYNADGQILDEVYEYGSFLQSKMHANHVRCTDCHDPHSLKLKFTGNQLCGQCHIPAKYDTEAHHHHKPGTPGAQCIECHMPSRLYMVIDQRRDHSFRAPRPDLTVSLGTPNACNNCHTAPNETPEWAADAVVKWFGPKRAEEPSWAPAIAAGRAGKPEAEELLVELADRNTTPAIVRATAIDLLANYAGNRSVAARRKALTDIDPLVRVTAVRAVSGGPDSQLISDLAQALDDPIRFVRVAAAAQLFRMPLDQLTTKQQASFERAMLEFRKSQELSLDHAGGHLTLAALDRRYGRTFEAVKHLQAAIQLEPYMAGPRGELASLMQHVGGNAREILRLREEEANLLERDSKLAPNNATIFYELGRLRFLLDQLDEAQAAWNNAVALSPQTYEFLMMLALLHERRYVITGDEEQYKATVEALKKLNELLPDDPRTRGIFLRLMETRQSKQGETPASPLEQ